MLIVITGNGKGKTTSAIGQGIRALGRGKKVLMVQFIKSPQWKSGEDFVIEKLKGFDLIKGGKGFVGILGDNLPFEEHQLSAQKTFELAKAKLKDYDFLILDEINVALSLKLLDKDKVLSFLKEVPEEKVVILTGRGALPEIIELADLVSEIKEVKHPFKEGKKAKIGIEY